MKKKAMTLLLSLALAAGTLSACGSSGGPASSGADKPTQDRSGNAISVPDEVNSIISMAPSTTELLLDLGLSDKIVAVDTYSVFSYGDRLADDIKTFDMMAPDNEQIAALAPDIVFTTGMSSSGGEDVFAAVKEAGVTVADIPSSASLDDIALDIAFIGDCVGESDKAGEIVKEMKESISELKKIGSGIEDKETVLYELSTPTADYPTIYTCGAGTYIDEMLTVIGAENVAGDADYAWPALSEEEAVAANPDVILSGDTYTPDVVDVILDAEGWEHVSAVESGRVYAVDGDAVNRPNQHVISAMVEMAKLIYPDEYSSVSDPFAASK